MADQYGLFWNSVNNDRGYTADSFAEWLNHFFTTGVFSGELQVTAVSGMDIKVGSGYANLKGKVRFFDSATTYTLATAGATYPRIDTVVVERNDTDRKISIKVVTGTYNGSNPSPTAPVRSAAIYQIVLAQIYVAAGATKITQANITDTRSNNSVCGIVTGTVKEMDYSQFAAQFSGYYSDFKNSNKADFDTWFNQMKNQLTTDAAGKLQTEVNTINSNISSMQTSVNSLNSKMATTKKNITLTSSGWSNGTYTISDSLITASSYQEIIPSESITSDQMKALQRASLVQTAQAGGSITIKAFGTVPSIDIPIIVIFRGEK